MASDSNDMTTTWNVELDSKLSSVVVYMHGKSPIIEDNIPMTAVRKF